jgi:C_GCAxxG_C_C family probable redox protein
MSKTEKALHLFANNFNCAQSVLAACGPDTGLDERTCLMMTAPFGGGLARNGEVCGAVSGALMTIGLRDGAAMAADPASARAELYGRTDAFLQAFRQRNGGLTCRELTGCDLHTPEGQQQFKERELHQKLCTKLIASAIELLEQK